MNSEDWTTAGIKAAQQRHRVGMSEIEVSEQYKEIRARPIGDVKPYVAPEEKPDTGALKPAQIRGMKLFGISASILSGCAAFIQQAATGAFNTYFGWAIVGGMGAFFLSGLRGGSVGRASAGDNSGNQTGSTGGGNITVTNTTIIQR